jgi:TRAP-type uncharacterized transport system substrate-binding protein
MKILLTALLATTVLSIGANGQEAPIRLCTGAESGVYFNAGKLISQFSGNIEVVETAGTYQNMDLLLSSDPATGCDAMIGQPDGPVYLKRTKPADANKISRVMKLHREYLQVLCSKESGIENLSDIKSSHTVAVGDVGSGAWLIWQNFIEQDDSYGEVKTSSDSGITALTSVASNEAQCMILPSGVPNSTVSEADVSYGDAVILVPANDKDFNDAEDIDGKSLYEFTDLPTDKYPQTFNRYWGDIQTVSWNAGLYVNKGKLKGKRLEGFLKAATRARTSILAEYGK